MLSPETAQEGPQPNGLPHVQLSSNAPSGRREGQQKQQHQKGTGHREKDPESPEGTRETMVNEGA
jgi:hypothetical protein